MRLFSCGRWSNFINIPFIRPGYCQMPGCKLDKSHWPHHEWYRLVPVRTKVDLVDGCWWMLMVDAHMLVELARANDGFMMETSIPRWARWAIFQLGSTFRSGLEKPMSSKGLYYPVDCSGKHHKFSTWFPSNDTRNVVFSWIKPTYPTKAEI